MWLFSFPFRGRCGYHSFVSGFARDVMSRGLRFGLVFSREFVVLGRFLFPVRKNNSLTCLRHVCTLKEPLRWQLKNCFTRIWFAWLVEVPALFSSGRKVLYCSLPLDQFGTSCYFPRGGKSSVWIVCRRSTSLERCAVFSGRKDFVCLSSLNWTSSLTSRHSTNLELRAVFVFFQGTYSSVCIVYRRSTNLECRAVFLREEIDFICLWLL